ncbi:response regulator transcription factor [Enterococcus diestrammenae]|uniref:response regulator transcription factor n=1 Tax=Enterococcus diestrammenae TaxID=1155073 RepID=UPI00195A12D4
MTKILIVEDDRAIAQKIGQLLATHGYQWEAVYSMQQALTILTAEQQLDLLLIDLNLPDGSGYAVGTQAKAAKIPFIFLTAMEDEASVVTGFDLGGDDYIVKPFRPMELLSRIKNVLRRRGKSQAVFTVEDLTVDVIKGLVTKKGEELFLSPLEYRLLLVFINHSGQVLTRDQLFQEIWDLAGNFVNDNTLTVYIKRLREKIEVDPQHPTKIKTVRGLGYKLEV